MKRAGTGSLCLNTERTATKKHTHTRVHVCIHAYTHSLLSPYTYTHRAFNGVEGDKAGEEPENAKGDLVRFILDAVHSVDAVQEVCHCVHHKVRLVSP